MKLLVLDGNSIANRAFYGIKILSTKNGEFTNAIFGFMNIFSSLLKSEKPDAVAVAFDLKAPTFRHKMYDGYKAQRKGMPEELASQMPIIKNLIELLGYTIISCEGYEADDIIGTLSHHAYTTGNECVISTGDRDSLQLVNKKVKVLLASSRKGKSETIIMDEDAVFEKYNVTPKQLIQVKALMGDTSDNIPGVMGVGEKTALTLIQNFKTLDGVYENIDNSIIKKGAREKLLKDKENAYLSLELATINLNSPVELDLEKYAKKDADVANAKSLFAKLEMFSMIDKFSLNAVTTFENNVVDENLEEVCALPLTSEIYGDVIVFYTENNEIVIVKDKKVFITSPNNINFLEMLSNKNTKIKTFDAKKLYHLALNNNIDVTNIVFDAKLCAYLLNPSSNEYTLQRLCSEYGAIKEFSCQIDEAGCVFDLFEKLQENCSNQNMSKLYNEIELPLCKVLAEMEHLGVLIDKEGLMSFGEALQLTLENSEKQIHEYAGEPFNVNSPKQLAEVLYEKLGLPTSKKTKSGYSTNAETLEGLKKHHPIIEHILEYRTYQKLHSTYVEGLLKVIGEDGRIHSTFNQTETRTGRLSSGEPNLQNIPVRTKLGANLRKYFIAKEGYVFIDADYSQIELRILAHLSNDETMLQAFKDGKDIHTSTAAKIYDVPEEMITPQIRSSAKAVNFGIVYGISAFGLSRDINTSVSKANEFIKTYLENFKNIKEYMDETKNFAKANGYVETLYGRRRLIPEILSSNYNVRSLGERMAMNTPIQGTAADIIKIAMIRVYDRLRKENLQSKLILQVHDELIIEAPQEEQFMVLSILQEEMEQAASLKALLSVEVNVGETWYDAKG